MWNRLMKYIFMKTRQPKSKCNDAPFHWLVADDPAWATFSGRPWKTLKCYHIGFPQLTCHHESWFSHSFTFVGTKVISAPSITVHKSPGFIAFVIASATIRSVLVHRSLVMPCFGNQSVNNGSPNSSPRWRQISWRIPERSIANLLSVTVCKPGWQTCSSKERQSV